jgi:selenide,water dikinase
VLRHLPRFDDPNLLVGEHQADDAAVYRLSDDTALVQTVDFFTPIVDDPYLYGQIAAANSLSDVYALGGTPRIALNIVGFPVKELSLNILSEVLRGGADKAREAGVTIIGGHTIDDTEPKYGLAATGTVDPRDMVTARGAKPGDLLVLTKPLGTGLIGTAIKAGNVEDRHVAQAVRWMTMLNRDASLAMMKTRANAATDISGFGLLGHLIDLCDASGVSAEVDVEALPILPAALDLARGGNVPGGTYTNLEYADGRADLSAIDETERLLIADPQTSGGLLICLPADRLGALRGSGSTRMLTAVVGRIRERSATAVTARRALTLQV